MTEPTQDPYQALADAARVDWGNDPGRVQHEHLDVAGAEPTGAALLREAAAKMRERAERATPSPWTEWHEDETEPQGGQWSICPPATGALLIEAGRRPFQDRMNDASFIASWHPAVALKVASLLEWHATEWGGWAAIGTSDADIVAMAPDAGLATALAREYLGYKS